MDPITSRLEPIFGSFPEAVLYLYGGQVAYSNDPGTLLRSHFPEDLIFAMAEHPNGAMAVAREEADYRVTVSPFEGGVLLVFRTMPRQGEEQHPFSHAVFQMREYLANMNAVQTRMRRELEKKDLVEAFEQDLSSQSRLLYRMLRLTRQAELTQELNDKVFPQEEGFDFAMVCQGMAEETAWLADLAGVRFQYTSNVEHLAFKGSKSLLTQMLLALVSNSVRAAGKGGTAEMDVRAEGGHVRISLRDSGMGIPEDRMATLFSGKVPDVTPRPGEGAGLGLYNARRIATLHKGVLIASSGHDGGTSLVVSLPIVPPSSVPARNNPGYDNLGGYSPVRTELSDILPWQAFTPPKKED